jgi:hypothetical protein
MLQKTRNGEQKKQLEKKKVKLISVDIQGIHGSGQAIMSIVPQPFLAS